MSVQDDHIDALRAYLRHDLTEFERLAGQGPSPNVSGALFAVAFLEATRLRFGEQCALNEVIRYVLELRQRLTHRGNDDLEPRVTELLIRGALGDPVDLSGVEESARAHTQIAVLDDIMTERQMDEDELNAFLSRVREETKRRLAFR